MTLSPAAQEANVGLVCEASMCSLSIDWPGAEWGDHACPHVWSGRMNLCLEAWSSKWGSSIHAHVRASAGERANSLLGAGPPLRAYPCQRVQLQIWFPSSSNRQQGWGSLSRILIVILHVAELHECGGRWEQPAAMWRMREKPQERASLGFIGELGRRQSPETPKSGWQGDRESF